MKTKEKTLAPVNRIAEQLGQNGHKESEAVIVTPPNIVETAFLIEGIAPLCLNRFSHKAQQQIIETQERGSLNKKGKKRDPKDFDECYQQARHIATEGWDGFPCSAVRCGLIAVCRLTGFKMTIAKLSIFCLADGYSKEEGTPLVKITKGKPSRKDMPVRLVTGVIDIRARPVWEPGWQARIRVEYDADQFTLQEVTNLMARMGLQNGLGEGRPNSSGSNGIGYGRFKLINE